MAKASVPDKVTTISLPFTVFTAALDLNIEAIIAFLLLFFIFIFSDIEKIGRYEATIAVAASAMTSTWAYILKLSPDAFNFYDVQFWIFFLTFELLLMSFFSIALSPSCLYFRKKWLELWNNRGKSMVIANFLLFLLAFSWMIYGMIDNNWNTIFDGLLGTALASANGYVYDITPYLQKKAMRLHAKIESGWPLENRGSP